MEERKSRTISLTDDDWQVIAEAAERLGFGPRGRGRAMVFLAKRYIKQHEPAD